MRSDYFDYTFDEDDSDDCSELHTSYTEQNPSSVRSFVSPEANFSQLHTAVRNTSALLEPHSASYKLTPTRPSQVLPQLRDTQHAISSHYPPPYSREWHHHPHSWPPLS